MAQEKDWHLDKKVPVVLFFMILANICTSVWWASSINSMVNQHEQRIGKTESAVLTITSQQGGLYEKLARIEEGQKYQTQMIAEMRIEMKRDDK